ncbi:MAG: hypothetical protein QOE86_854, partial [Solirubrobacteraceae bacterium]|nr:hypothetical protein [Solirubrobacteraceae bacterium]
MRTFARVLRMLRRPGRWKRRRGRLVTVELDGLPADLPPDPRRPWVVLDVHVRGGSVGQVFERAPEGLTGARQLELVATRLGGPAAHRAVRMALRDALTGGTPENAGPIPPVSVVICTRDRPDDLAVCLSATARLDPPPLEVIVVDNAPGSEATSDLCAAHPGVVHVVEPVPGLCRARNRGIAVARGAWVAFTDDDCVPEPDWLAPLAAAARDPLVSAVCGHALPLEVEAPSQYLFEAHGGFERHPDRWVHDPIAHPPHGVAFTAGAGANMILRRDALLAIGGFRADTGPGSAAPLSDEKEVFLRLALAGHRLVHDPASRVRHRHRREPELLRSTLRSYGRSEVAFALYAAARHRAWRGLATPRWWVRHSLGDLRSSVRDRPRSVPARLALEELGGMLEGPAAAWRALRTPPVPLPPAAEPAALERIEVGAEAPAVSVALATHQRRESVVETLRGLAQQTLAPERFEVVVVVDGSTDGTAAAVRELALPFGLRVHEQANRGLAATRNAGAALAAHPLVVFLDDDIRPDPDWLAAHAARHAETGDRVVLGIYPPRLPGPGSDWWTQAVAAWWADHFRRKLEPGHRWTLLDVIDGNLS